MPNNAPRFVQIVGGSIAAYMLFCAAFVPSDGATPTKVTMFSPWTPAGTIKANMRVVERVSGNCWTESLATSRGDAYRCMAGNSIYDPCFAQGAHPKTVACANDPFSNKIALFKLLKPLPFAPTPMTQSLQPHNQPFGIILADGDKCVFVTGATDAVNGDRLNYACGRDGWIIGTPSHSNGVWTAQTVQWPKKHVTTVSIAEAVF
ncbi:MAG TPA: hypothetical protein VGF18_02095 [Candidatus Tumulicola sp.]|jgi:hypothetical protein